MPWYKNVKPSVIGLSFQADKASGPRLIEPGAVFEANEDEIPKSYLDQKWVESTEAPKGGSAPSPDSETAKTGSGQYTGPDPAQASQTSVLESATDKEAAESGAYSADRDHKRRK